MSTAMLLTLGTALAMQIPAGWTALGTDRAVLNAKDPTLGEIREYSLSGGSGEPSELVDALKTGGIQARLLARTANGIWSFQTTDGRLIQAQVSVAAGKSTWCLIMAVPDAAAQLDVNALLTTAQSRIPVQLSWGSDVEVLPAGADGSLWALPQDQPAGVGWSVGEQVDRWVLDSSLYGLWTGVIPTRDGPVEIKLWLEASGRARLEKVAQGRMCISEGTWGVRGKQLRLAYYTGDPLVSPFESTSKELSFTMDDRRISLRKIK